MGPGSDDHRPQRGASAGPALALFGGLTGEKVSQTGKKCQKFAIFLLIGDYIAVESGP